VVALEYGLEMLKTLPVSLRLIKEIHAKLMQGVRGEIWTPGEFRTRQNWIGAPGATLEDAAFVPPPPQEMINALDKMEQFINHSSEAPHLIRLGMLHYQFEAIHPFADGNGRIGRLLIALLMHTWGILTKPVLNISAYFETDRQSYYDHLLAVSQRGEWEEWLVYFLAGVKQESVGAINRIQALDTLRTEYLIMVRKKRAGERLSRAVDAVFSSPILTIRQLENELSINYTAAERCMERLLVLGILRELTGHARNRIYQADEIMKILNK
jgi:Fic family protein